MNHGTRFAKLVLLLALVGALALGGCGGDNGLSAADQARIDKAEADKLTAEKQAEQDRLAKLAAEQAEEARLAAIQDARQKIGVATTAEAAQAAYDAVKDRANPTEGEALQTAVDTRIAALAAMDSAATQKMALMDAAGNVDVRMFDLTTAEGIAAANTAINALKAALADAEDVSDADKAMYQLQLDAAEAPVMVAQAEAARMARIEAARQAIAAAETPAAAQAAYDAVKDDATATEGAGLQGVVDMRIAALATMDRAATQKMALMMAAGNVDTSDLMTAQDIADANTAINALKAALADAVDVSDADKAMYQATVGAAEMAMMTAQSVLDHAAQMMALTNAVTDLQAIDLSGLSDQAKIDAAQDAVDALKMALEDATELSDAEKSAAMVELATAYRTVMMAQGRVDIEGQMMMISGAVDALGAIDLNALMTQAQIDAAEKAIIELDLALDTATDLTAAQKLDATVDVTLAKRRVMAAQEVLASNIEGQTMALTTAGTALGEIDLDDLDTPEKIADADTAVKALKMALDDATHLSDADKAMYQTQLKTATETVRMAQTGMDLDGRVMAQRTALTTAMMTARTAVGMVGDDASDDQVTAADNAIAALQEAIDGAEDLPEGDTGVATAQGTLTTLTGLLASAKMSRMAAMEEDAKADNADMMATAMKLHMGISAPDATSGAGQRSAAYDTDGNVGVTIGGSTAVALTADKMTVAALHGWEGKRYTAEPDDDGMYEAMVYSNVGEPTEGAKFNAGPANGGYDLTEGMLTIDAAATVANAAKVASSSFDQSAGTKQFKLPSPNLSGATKVTFSGSFHGVSGTYTCTPTDGTTCAANKAAEGFTLGLRTDASGMFDANDVVWTFKPTNPEARVMSASDMDYVSYGWWIHKGADGMWTASAFVDDMGPADPASGIDPLRGTAKYMGGAAGKYALYSPTGGTNDAGHFTAKAMLEADFDTDMVSGIIDTFMGADGKARDWSVELMKSAIGGTGLIRRSDNDNTNLAASDPGAMTKWTIGGTAAAAAGEWSGALKDNGDDNVPNVATGTFYSVYGPSGKMVGGFGVNKQ